MPFWRRQPILKGYVSEIDRFLQELDQKARLTSLARQAEEAKYIKLNALRDKTNLDLPIK